MKRLLGCVAFLLFFNFYAIADTLALNFDLRRHFQPTPEYIVLENPQITIVENISGLSGQCPLMQEKYLKLWHEYSAESSQLMSLLDQSRNSTPNVKGDRLTQIQEMQVKLRKTIEGLNRLAHFEWNQQSLMVLVRWSLPQSILFDIPEADPDIRDSFVSQSMADFLALKGMSVKPGFSTSALKNLKDWKKKTFFAGLDYRVTDAQYMGEGSATLLPFFMVQSFFFQDLMVKNISFDYYKPMTWLEYCQFIQTAEFSVDVKFALKNFGGVYAEKNQKFILRSTEDEK